MNCRASVGPFSIPRATQFQRSLPRSGWRLFALGVFAAGSWGCGGKDEPVSTVPTGNATISATESSAIASPVGDDEPDSRVKSSSSASPGRMSLSDLDLAESAVGPKSDEASSTSAVCPRKASDHTSHIGQQRFGAEYSSGAGRRADEKVCRALSGHENPQAAVLCKSLVGESRDAARPVSGVSSRWNEVQTRDPTTLAKKAGSGSSGILRERW